MKVFRLFVIIAFTGMLMGCAGKGADTENKDICSADSIAYYCQQAELGDYRAMYIVTALCNDPELQKRFPEVKEKYGEVSLDYLQTLAENNYLPALFSYGRMIECRWYEKRGIPASEGIKYIRLAAEQGNPVAIEYLKGKE